MRLALAVLAFLALVVLAPLASAHMSVDPDELDLAGGEYTTFHVSVQNFGSSKSAAYSLSTEGSGLLVTYDAKSGTIAAHSSVDITATVRAPPWVTGDRDVHVHLYEKGEEVDDRIVTVHVTPIAGLPTAVVQGATLVGAASLGAGIVGLVGWRRWHLLAIAMYARLRRSSVERHPTRRLLVEIVRATPGIGLAEAQRASGLANGTFEHHLHKLIGAGIVVMIDQGRARYLRLAEAGPIDPALGTSASVATFVRERGRVRASEVARELRMSRQALHYHIRQLADKGLIDARLERGRLVLSSGGSS